MSPADPSALQYRNNHFPLIWARDRSPALSSFTASAGGRKTAVDRSERFSTPTTRSSSRAVRATSNR
ncbi:AcrB/AcrD/AcrF family protein [Bradyrhizobium elkanii USDA 61]|nr:AcrB/AcrD/AcrF family protein [Bradyrhizobium elkanii USDA 61]